MTFLVTFDGTLQSKHALRYGLRKARMAGAEVRVLSIFHSDWYREYEGAKAEELGRREWCRHIEEAIQILDEEGEHLSVSIVALEGSPAEQVRRYAGSEKIDMIIASPRFRALIGNAPCPVRMIPGKILVPVDNTDNSFTIGDEIVKEARLAASKVILLGLIPIHLYNRWERRELREIRRETLRMLKGMREMLQNEGIATETVLRSGFPDEEILRASEEYQASLIMLADRGQKPSELTKAARMLINAPELPGRPVVLVPSMAAV